MQMLINEAHFIEIRLEKTGGGFQKNNQTKN